MELGRPKSTSYCLLNSKHIMRFTDQCKFMNWREYYRGANFRECANIKVVQIIGFFRFAKSEGVKIEGAKNKGARNIIRVR